ncbi:hypothetical protein RM780_09655 [Streptomyces sp. DSM 44917]|uniref:Uncharacterized protein n=1 Tax=Streptomyces boetiae TaxID=3075541 RepID=A0ABU2L6W6_9ACTN|nr:hypothetical protein [Streptomyces sp. DSM 44917]MDT0307227.1 hypothetical protein [Streptomyces sp. DSM 44917]
MAVTQEHRRELVRRFRSVLTAAQGERPTRPGLVVLESGRTESAWVAHERSVMHQEVNRVRAELALPAVSLEAVAAAEEQAVGHSDYSGKFAMYCADLATGEVPARGG